jgi:hypothetical protein
MLFVNPSLKYVIDNFTSKKMIDDYILLIKALHVNGQTNPALRPYGYDVFVGQGGFDFDRIKEQIIKPTNHWFDRKPPKMLSIIQPYREDPLWVKVRVKAVQAAIVQKSQSKKTFASNRQVIGYIKRFGDVSPYMPPDGELDNPLLDNAWKGFYEKNKIGSGASGEGSTLFGNWFALGVYIDYVILRLQGFDISKKEFKPGDGVSPPANGGTPPATGGNPPGNGGSQTEIETDIDEDYANRYSVLEEYLIRVSGPGHNPSTPTATASVYNEYAARNGVKLWDPSLPPTDAFTVFQKIFAPAKESNILENTVKFQKILFAKIENSGLIDLLVQSDQIRQFGRDRFKNEESVKASAGKVVRRRQRYSLASKLG